MRRLLLGLLLAAATPAPNVAVADPRPAHPVPDAQPPAGRVGRLAFVSGKVELRVAGGTAWTGAAVNYPVAVDTAVRTAANSRAAIEIGADWVELSDGTMIEIGALDDQAVDVALARGRIDIALQRGFGEVEIDLAPGEVWLRQPGEYRIDARGGAPPRIAVFAGSARLYAGGAEIGIMPGEAVQFSDATPVALTIGPAEAFAPSRREPSDDRARLAAPYFVSPDMTGSAALDAAGRWRRTSAYGEVWLPNVLPAGWTPYRDGFWRWIPPWGWTWIDDQPWGFAPFHYGRWVLLGDSWAWVPGSFVANPIYMPATVAFLGTPGIGVSYADGSGPAIGWFPLAPGEAYWPSYTDDLDYIRAANRGDVADLDVVRRRPDGRLPVEVVDRRFANRLSASVVPRPVFVGGLPVAPALLDLPTERLEDVPVVMGSPRIGPPAPAPPSTPPVVATAQASRPAPHAVSVAAKRAIWVKGVHLATIRVRRYWEAARLRHFVVLRLRAPAVAEPPGLRGSAAPRRMHHQARHRKEAAR